MAAGRYLGRPGTLEPGPKLLHLGKPQHHSRFEPPNMLSSRLLRQPTRRLLAAPCLRPPPLPALSHGRAFHATAPRGSAVLDAFLTLPHEMLSLLHTQMPWYAAIPASAFVVRALLVTLLGSRSRAITARYIGTQPLRDAMTRQIRDSLMKEGGFSSPKQAKSVIAAAVKKETEALDRRWNCSLWTQVNWTVAQIPIFFTMAEVVRQMCSTQDGLLSLSLRGLGLKDTPAAPVHGISMDYNPWYEPTLASEGMLWFPDLLAPDPTGVLPFVVSGLMFSNIYFSKNSSGDPNDLPRFSRNVRRMLLGVSLLIGPLCQHLPAALMLYWAGSTSSVIVWNWWLDWRHPTPNGFNACRRPLHLLPASKPRRA